MNEFEWRRQLRDLRQPLTPERDLWVSIDAALVDAEPHSAGSIQSTPKPQPETRRHWLATASLAASALLAIGIGWHVLRAPATMPVASTQSVMHSWKPTDPRLAGAATELDAARMELQQAMLQAPDSLALQRLLLRTEHQQTQLRQLAREAG
jgi:hypothetical protein